MIRWAMLVLTFAGQQPDRYVAEAKIAGVYDNPQDCEWAAAKTAKTGEWVDERRCMEVDGDKSLIRQVDDRYGLLALKMVGSPIAPFSDCFSWQRDRKCREENAGWMVKCHDKLGKIVRCDMPPVTKE